MSEKIPLTDTRTKLLAQAVALSALAAAAVAAAAVTHGQALEPGGADLIASINTLSVQYAAAGAVDLTSFGDNQQFRGELTAAIQAASATLDEIRQDEG